MKGLSASLQRKKRGKLYGAVYADKFLYPRYKTNFQNNGIKTGGCAPDGDFQLPVSPPPAPQ